MIDTQCITCDGGECKMLSIILGRVRTFSAKRINMLPINIFFHQRRQCAYSHMLHNDVFSHWRRRFSLPPVHCCMHLRPNIYRNDSRFVCFCCGLILVKFAHILRGCFSGIRVIKWLFQCRWISPNEYGQIKHTNPQAVDNITTTWESHKTTCIFHGFIL